MSLFKRADVYWVDIRHRGRRIRKSTGTIELASAQEFHDQVKADLWRIEKLGDRPRKTWKDAVMRWLLENQQKKSLNDDKRRFKLLHAWLGGSYLDEIDRELVDRVKYERASQSKVNAKGMETGKRVSVAEVNRLLALLRSVLNAARDDWEWIERAPKVKLFMESTRRVRWLTPEQVANLLSVLPTHTRYLVRFTLATGLREQNVLQLKWSQVDLSRRIAWLHDDETKNGNALGVPLSEEALTVVRQNLFKHKEYVFSYRGSPIKRANSSAWRNGLKKANITDFRWHDLRHTWASWHVQNGTALNVLQELGGWESVEMVRRYAHLGRENLASAADNLPIGHILDTANV